MSEQGRLPTLHIVADSLPQAYYRAIKAVWGNGAVIRTQYDRKNEAGEFIDPPSRDARVLIEVINPFAQPRFSPLSFCEIGVYLAEIMGAKNYKVLPMSKLLAAREGKPLPSSDWPYTYHQRLTAHPEVADAIIGDLEYELKRIQKKYTEYRKPGANDDINAHYWLGILLQSLAKLRSTYCGPIDQIAKAVETLVRTPHSRRAICTTAIPNLDPYLTEDIPCLRELQLRCPEDEDGNLVLNASATWRSRDLYKAWGDNVIAISFMLETIARQIQALSGRKCRVGSYADYSGSLHIYGQDFGAVGGSTEKGLSSFFETFPTEDDFIARSLDSDTAKEMLVLPQLRVLLEPKSIEQWQFPPASITIIKDLIAEIDSGQLIV